MLKELKITNLALISEVMIELGSGLSVLTGETGAGKSIILQSINLLYGEKAARSWVRSGADTAVVEALFECADGAPVLDIIRDQGFESDDGTIIVKRIISAKGSSRYYLNGGLATGRVVGQVTENLISVLKLHDELNLALKEIGERERMILEFRHGLTGQTAMTLEEVGKRLKLSRERIRQIEERALLRLRRVANRMGLIEVGEQRSMGAPKGSLA